MSSTSTICFHGLDRRRGTALCLRTPPEGIAELLLLLLLLLLLAVVLMVVVLVLLVLVLLLVSLPLDVRKSDSPNAKGMGGEVDSNEEDEEEEGADAEADIADERDAAPFCARFFAPLLPPPNENEMAGRITDDALVPPRASSPSSPSPLPLPPPLSEDDHVCQLF